MSVMILREGPLRLRLHANKSGPGGKYRAWEFRWRDGAGRIERVTRSSRAEAEREARQRLKLAATAAVTLSREDAASYAAYLTLQDRARAAGFADLAECVRLALAHRPAAALTEKDLPALVAEMLAARKAEGAKSLHLTDLKNRLGRFAREVKVPLPQLTGPMLHQWLYQLDVAPRTRLNFHGAVSNFLSWCKSAKYLPRDFAEMESVRKPALAAEAVEIFSADEMRWLLANAAESVLPELLLSGFAGLRQSETQLLDWSHINWRERHIVVPAGKTGRRLVPLLDNLRDWLEPMRGCGRIVQLGTSGISAALARSVKRANAAMTAAGRKPSLAWKRNAPRHSYVSYRVAATKNLPAVSLETGHSVTMLRKHYLETVTPAEAAGWFGLGPEVRGQVQLTLFRAEAEPRETAAESCP